MRASIPTPPARDRALVETAGGPLPPAVPGRTICAPCGSAAFADLACGLGAFRGVALMTSSVPSISRAASTLPNAVRNSVSIRVMRSRTSLGERLGFRPVDDAGFLKLPPVDAAEADDEDQMSAKLEAASYEVPAWEWRPIHADGEPEEPPQRFIDGSLHSRTVGVIRVGSPLRPFVVPSLGAAEWRLDGRGLLRPADSDRTHC